MGRKIVVSKRKKKGCRMMKGAERQREVQPEVMGWEGQMEQLPSLLCVWESLFATGEGIVTNRQLHQQGML